jgi:hypothetical protein
MGVSFFSESSPDDFLHFDRSFLALFRVIAGETWIDSLPMFNEDGGMNTIGFLFILSFVVINNWTLLQVSVAVLLDRFISATFQMENEERESKKAELKKTRQVASTLDPLLAKLVNDYVDDQDLTIRLHTLFQVIEVLSSDFFHTCLMF